jgi:hypothetical protein
MGVGLGCYAGPLTFRYPINLTDPFLKRIKDLNKFLIKLATPNRIFQALKMSRIQDPNYLDNRIMLFGGLLIKNQPEIFHKMVAEIEKDKLMSIIFKKMSKKLKSSYSLIGISLTNIGLITLNEKYGDLELKKVVFCPPSSLATDKLIGVCTFAGTIQHSIISYEDQMDKKKLKDFIDKYIDLLKKF